VERAGNGVATAFDKVSSWLDARGNGDAGGGDDEDFDADS
jgi:hypothetical protein